jgi:cysteinyl-tRNA synthetase
MKIKAGARIEMVPGKKNPTDFALWKFTPKGIKRQMEWDSPWGRGFPGWHTECVVMSKKFLGVPFDIHCGGVDHILIHHTNEIAQAEAAYGEILANYWLHGEFLLVEGKKMAKSLGNIYTLNDLIEKGFNPLAYRYLCLGAHYRSKLNFTFDALKSAKSALENLYEKVRELKSKVKNQKIKLEIESKKKFLEFINDDLDTPKALALMWDLISKNKIDDRQKYFLLLDFDRVFGLNLEKIKKPKIPQEIRELVKIREDYRKRGDFKSADEIREKIKEMGYWIEDTKEGPKIKKLAQ